MRSNRIYLLVIATTFFAVGTWSGCTVGFDPGDQDGQVFPCETNEDCIDHFVCNEEGWCEEVTLSNNGDDNAPPCDQTANPPGDIDQDNDGFGDGDNRRACPPQQKERDCNDADPEVYPGAPERCNGIDDNCDGEGDGDQEHLVDEFDCETDDDCASLRPPSHLSSYLSFWECANNTCVMRPFDQSGECADVAVTCQPGQDDFTYTLGGTTYEATEGPVLECR